MKVATLRLSGAKMKVRFQCEADPAHSSVSIQADDQAEAIYMSAQEARLLICALQTAIEELV